MQSFTEDKLSFLKRYYLILCEVGLCFHSLNNGYNKYINNMVMLCTTHTTIHVVNTKPELMKFDQCTWKLKAKNTINGCRNTDYNGLGNDPYNA